MAEAILSLAAPNGWSLHLRLVDKRRAHYILQLVGSGLAISGSFIKIIDKDQHWTTLHGKFGTLPTIQKVLYTLYEMLPNCGQIITVYDFF